MLSVITSYKNRIENLKTYLQHIYTVGGDIEFIVIGIGHDDEARKLCQQYGVIYDEVSSPTFNTGLAHNHAVKLAKNEWILKQDVDLIAYNGFYRHLLNYLKNNTFNNLLSFEIIPAIWLNRDYSADVITQNELENILKNKNLWDISLIAGNEFVFSRTLWSLIGGSPEWDCHGFEDYYIALKMKKIEDASWRLKSDGAITYDNCDTIVRDQLILEKNQKWVDMQSLFVHRWHKKVRITHSPVNKQRLFTLIKDGGFV